MTNIATFDNLVIAGVVYPLVYEIRKIYLIGLKGYFTLLSNISDSVYIFGSLLNIFLQKQGYTHEFITKLVITILLMQQIIKTFKILRIFEQLSYIVSMLSTVIFDLRVFILFYSILIGFFSMVFAVIGL